MRVDQIICKNILATITYYDVLDRPLTVFEVWKDLIRCSADHTDRIWTLEEIYRALQTKEVRQYVQEKNGFYFLSGRDALVDIRRTRAIISTQKKKDAYKIVRILSYSPFVRMICVTGRLSYDYCEEQSDIDLLVVYEDGHIWTGRFFMTILAHVCGFRRYGIKVRSRACLNYHITTASLTVPTQDLFAAHEYSQMFPVFDTGYFSSFCTKNTWITTYKPHFIQEKMFGAIITDSMPRRMVRCVFEWIFGDRGMERRLKRIQERKIISNPKTKYKGSIILFTDQFLIFLPTPHGPVVFDEYKKRFTALEINF